MSELVPSVISLEQGLNLKAPKLLATPGTMLDVLNYEQADVNGQSRINGYARYDGSVLPVVDEYYVIETTGYANAGDLLMVDGSVMGVVVAVRSGRVYFVLINSNLLPEEGLSVSVWNGGSFSVDAIYEGKKEEGLDPETHYQNLLKFANLLRARVESLPGPIAGLHWFGDRLYAVASMTAVPGYGMRPNDTTTFNGETVKVLDVIDGVAYISSTASTGAPSAYASFYESRSEIQVLQEDSGPYDFGWRFKDLGWKVLFNNGLSLYGNLVALNQNRSNLGIQGPTSIDGRNGSPLVLVQSVNISGAQAQVAGWKTSTSPTTYSLNPSAVESVDDFYIYADGLVEWNEDGDILAQGVGGGILEEKPPTNFVEILNE